MKIETSFAINQHSFCNMPYLTDNVIVNGSAYSAKATLDKMFQYKQEGNYNDDALNHNIAELQKVRAFEIPAGASRYYTIPPMRPQPIDAKSFFERYGCPILVITDEEESEDDRQKMNNIVDGIDAQNDAHWLYNLWSRGDSDEETYVNEHEENVTVEEYLDEERAYLQQLETQRNLCDAVVAVTQPEPKRARYEPLDEDDFDFEALLEAAAELPSLDD